MRIRTTLFAASLAALPALAFAQTQAPQTPAPQAQTETQAPATSSTATPPAATAPSTTAKSHHHHEDWRKRRAEMRQRYEKLSAADKAKFNQLRKQIHELHKQQMQLLGVGKS